MILVTPVEWYGLGALLVVCLLAVWRGGAPERRATAIVAVCWVTSVIVDNDGSRDVQWAIFGVDVFLAGWLTFEAMSRTRVWLLLAAGAQVVIVLTHVAFLMTPEIMQEGFFSAYYIWSYVVLLALALGSLFARRARANTIETQ